MQKLVKTYDFKTQQVSAMPAAELSPDYVFGQCEGIGMVWVKATDLKLATHYRHGHFEKEMLDLIEQEIRIPLAQVYPKSLSDWEDGFRMDMNPISEINVWCRIARAYTMAVKEHAFTLAQKRELFNVLIKASFGASEQELFYTLSFQFINEKQARRAFQMFREQRL